MAGRALLRIAVARLAIAGASLSLAAACSVETAAPNGGGGAGASSGSSSGASAGNAGRGGIAGAAAGNGGSAGRGVAGAGGAPSGGAASGAAGTTPVGGRGGNAASAGTSGAGGSSTGGRNDAGSASDTGGGGTENAGGAGATAGGTSNAGASAGGTAGSGGAGGTDSDRCDVANAGSQPPASVTLSGNLGTHDPVVIAAHGQFYLFSTGDNIGAKTSADFTSWQGASDVWSAGTRPDWIADEVPGATNLWAPDISYFGGQYHLYYSASTFGCNVSCIGHATRGALNTGSWTDHGSVVCSNPGSSCEGNRPDNWNAIDPNVIVDREGTAWLSFGSFWGGLKMLKLDQDGARADSMLHSIAARPNNGGALEAPFIVRRCGYYYLFTSWDTCCQGEDSTYNVRVGRSETVTGPYADKQGTALMQGGGTAVLAGNTRFRGPGHNAVIFSDATAYNVYHSYDANDNGNPVLRISELVWDEDGWPISGGP